LSHLCHDISQCIYRSKFLQVQIDLDNFFVSNNIVESEYFFLSGCLYHYWMYPSSPHVLFLKISKI
jgi:hypothetical protein